MPTLGDLDPPPGGTPGYYPDPLGGRYQRWWDGMQWQNRVGPPDGREPESPTRLSVGYVVPIAVAVLLGFLLDDSMNPLARVGVIVAAVALAELLFRVLPEKLPLRWPF